MKNKYSIWNMSATYQNTDYVKRTMKIPYETQALYLETAVPYISKQISYSLDFQQTIPLTTKDNCIILLLAIHGGLTFRQLKCFLQMQGYHVNRGILNELLWKLVTFGIIQLLLLDDLEQYSPIEERSYLYYYCLSKDALEIASKLGVQSLTPKHRNYIYSKYEHTHLVLGNIIWNQIIINQLLYSTDLLHFHLHGLITLPDGQKIEIPFMFSTKRYSYCFEYLSKKMTNAHYINELLISLETFQQNRKYAYVFVFMCANESCMKKVHDIVAILPEHKLTILYAYPEECFRLQSGTLHTWTEIGGMSGKVTIHIL